MRHGGVGLGRRDLDVAPRARLGVGVEETADVLAQHERVVDDAARDARRPQEPPEAVALEGAVVQVA